MDVSIHTCIYIVTYVHTSFYRYIYLIELNMAISAKDAVKQYKVELLRELPLEEAIFFAIAEKADLFPLRTGNSIRARITRAGKVDYFLQHVVEPAVEFYLPKLLEVMKNCEVANLEKLAGDIQAAVEQGTYIHMYICTKYVYLYVYIVQFKGNISGA